MPELHERRISYADKLMADVPDTHPAYEELWWLHYHGYDYEQEGSRHPRLTKTLEQYSLVALGKTLAFTTEMD